MITCKNNTHFCVVILAFYSQQGLVQFHEICPRRESLFHRALSSQSLPFLLVYPYVCVYLWGYREYGLWIVNCGSYTHFHTMIYTRHMYKFLQITYPFILPSPQNTHIYACLSSCIAWPYAGMWLVSCNCSELWCH